MLSMLKLPSTLPHFIIFIQTVDPLLNILLFVSLIGPQMVLVHVNTLQVCILVCIFQC